MWTYIVDRQTSTTRYKPVLPAWAYALETPMLRTLFLPALALQLALRLAGGTHACSYTRFTWLFLAYARWQAWRGHPHLLPVAACGAYAMAATWYGGALLLDRSIPARVRAAHFPWCGWTRFVVVDGVVHGLPLVSALQYHVWEHGRVVGAGAAGAAAAAAATGVHPCVAHCGLYSLLLHLLWAMVANNGGGFALDGLYVPCSARVWNGLWLLAVGAHAGGLWALGGG
jgi:hypothetical protein